MALDIYAKLTEKLDVIKGEGKNGPWKKQDFIVETMSDYPKNVCFSLWGERVDELEKFEIHSLLKVSFNPESREYNGRWYTDLRAWKIEAPSSNDQDVVTPKTGEGNTPKNENVTSSDFSSESSGEDDLPF